MHLRTMYTDGGCNNLDGRGSWAYVEPPSDGIDTVNVVVEFVPDTTNNRTEMMAIINAVSSLDAGSKIRIFSDSGYCVTGYNHPSYLRKWMECKWKTSAKKDVENQDLWHHFIRLGAMYDMQLCLIKGHSTDKGSPHKKWNDIVDDACTWMMKNYPAVPGRCILAYDLTSPKPKLIGYESYGVEV